MNAIRAYRDYDLDDLYRICLATGDAGEDGSALYRDPNIVGHVYVAPQAALSPETAFIVEDDDGVGGYIVGPADTVAWEARAERDWWPALRRVYGDPKEPATMDGRMARLIHHPELTPPRIAGRFPAHLHVNLLPRFQGRGLGRKLVDMWLARVAELGAHGAHLGVGERNPRAVAFYRACGFREVEREDGGNGIIFGIETARTRA